MVPAPLSRRDVVVGTAVATAAALVATTAATAAPAARAVAVPMSALMSLSRTLADLVEDADGQRWWMFHLGDWDVVFCQDDTAEYWRVAASRRDMARDVQIFEIVRI